MKKVKYSMILAGILCALTAFGCDDDAPSDQLCKETGGSMKDGHCVCNETSCGENMICSPDGSCTVNPGEKCEENEVKCFENAEHQCSSNGDWVKGKSCELSCAKDGIRCAECVENSCHENVLTQCVNNKANTIPCPYGCNSAGNDCKSECEAGQVKCDGKLRLECDAQTLTWKTAETCEGTCELDGSVTRCSTCTIDDPSNPPRRCVDDPETGIGQIEVCNGRFYEVEIIPVNPEDPDSAMKRNVCNNVSCKAGAVECGQCNNIIPKICENDYGNSADLYKTMGHVYSCTGGMKLEEKACRPSESSSDWYSCNADGTDCGVCMNGKQDSCVNDSRGYGYVDICKNGEYVNQKCERDLSCLGDGSGCKLCRYYSNAAENESTCNAAMSKPPYKLVCTESGTWDISECGRNEYCVVRSSGDGGYKAVCSL